MRIYFFEWNKTNNERHIDWSIFSLAKVVNILDMFSDILKPFYL